MWSFLTGLMMAIVLGAATIVVLGGTEMETAQVYSTENVRL